MISVKSVIFLLSVPVFVCGFFTVCGHIGLFRAVDPGRNENGVMAAKAVWPLLAAFVSEGGASDVDALAASPAEVSSVGDVSAVQSGNAIELRARIADADEVLFYAASVSLPVPLYLGRASAAGDGNWSYGFDTNERPLPRGKYRIYAEVTAGNAAYLTAAVELVIGGPEKVQNPGSVAIAKTVNGNLAAIADNDRAIEDAVRTAAVALIVLAGDNTKVREDLLSIAASTRQIENDNRTLTEMILERQDINENIRRIEEEIAGFPENTILSLRLEKISESTAARERSKELDQEIATLQARIGEEGPARQVIADELAGLAPADVAAAAKIINGFEKEVSKQELDTIAKRVALDKDSDQDGLSDENEISSKTDPTDPDSDGDGALDGDEVINGYDPLVVGGFEAAAGRDPREVAPLLADIYKVGQITSINLADGGVGLRLEGSALPGAYAQIYVYSVPVIVIVKADAQGHWSYDLDNPLPVGRHSACVARIGSRGGVEARSELALFENGATVYRTTTDEKSSSASSVEDLKNNFGKYVLIVTLAAMAIALLAIGFITSDRRRRIKGSDK